MDSWAFLLFVSVFFAGGSITLAETTNAVSNSGYSEKQDHLWLIYWLLRWKNLLICYLIFKLNLNQVVRDIMKFRSIQRQHWHWLWHWHKRNIFFSKAASCFILFSAIICCSVLLPLKPVGKPPTGLCRNKTASSISSMLTTLRCSQDYARIKPSWRFYWFVWKINCLFSPSLLF